MSLCYIYSKTTSYEHREQLLNSFTGSVSIDIETTDTISQYNIYIIELERANQEISLKLKNIFSNKDNALIYFIIPKEHTLLLFQLSFLLEAKAIITHSQNIEKIIAKIKIDTKNFLQKNLEISLGSNQLQTQKLLIYRSNKLFFITQNTLDTFICSDYASFSSKVLLNIDIENLLLKDTSISAEIQNDSNTVQKYVFKSVSISKTEKVISIQEASSSVKQVNFISTRVSFIELLKEQILQKNDSGSELTLLSINVTNVKALINEFGIVEFEDALLQLLSFMESTLERKIIFSQFENNFYVILFEQIISEEINNLMQHFLTLILHQISTNSMKFILDLYTISLENLELDTILTTLNNIENEDLSLNENNSSYIKHLTRKATKINAKYFLDAAYKNKMSFKILNIYHGLVINTSTKIVKTTNDHIYIVFEPLQGIVLQNERMTVLQSEKFSHDIYADVKEINLAKKVAILGNFKFLKTNANAREYARVTTSIKVPISLNTSGKTFNGTILDISIKSIAIKMKYSSNIGMPELGSTVLTFNLVDKTSEDGYVQLSLQAEITVVTIPQEDTYYKVVCELNQNTHDLDIVLKYVYQRQKELIIELKKMSKLN